jgi:hypothetical protein
VQNFKETRVKKHHPRPWLSLLKEVDYALDHSGSTAFLGALLISSHLLNSPSYARIVFALALLSCLTPKAVCGLYRMKGPRHK